jgi:hypothetical protein
MLQIAVVFFAFGLGAVVAAQPGNGLRLSLDGGFNNASTVLTYPLTDAQEIELRQSISAGSRWRGATRGRYDFHYAAVDFASGKLRAFVGANADYKYGGSVNSPVMVAPKAGLKIDVQPNTLVMLKTEYQSQNSGSFAYSLGIDFDF